MSMSKFDLLREFVFSLSYMLDDNISIDIAKVEEEIMKENVLEYLVADYRKYFSMTRYLIWSQEQNKAVSSLLKKVLISEFNPAQMGTSGDKWGISNNGLCLLLSLCGECLTHDVY